MARYLWKGSLSFGLVEIPVGLRREPSLDPKVKRLAVEVEEACPTRTRRRGSGAPHESPVQTGA